MVFTARYTFSKTFPPAKVYLHTVGINEAWGEMAISQNAPDYFLKVLNDYSFLNDYPSPFSRFGFLIAGLWGRKNTSGGIERVVDIFGFEKISPDKWPGNPEVSILLYAAGELSVPQKEHTCGDTLIMLGREEAFRRTTKSLKEYFTFSPSLEDVGLGPRVGIRYD